MFLHTKVSYESKYQYLIKQCEDVGLKYFKVPKALIEYLSDMQDVYDTIEEYNPGNKQKMLKVFDDMIAVLICNR